MVTLAPVINAHKRKSYANITVCPNASKKGPGMKYTKAILAQEPRP